MAVVTPFILYPECKMIKKYLNKNIDDKIKSLNLEEKINQVIDDKIKSLNLHKIIQEQIEAKVADLLPESVKKYVIENCEQVAPVIKKIENENIKASTTPWVNIKSEDYNAEDGTYQLELDWNPAFITELRKSGFNAASEDEMVKLWLASLTRVH